VESVVLAPSERAVVDVLVDRPGELHLEHHTPDRVSRLATMVVRGEPTATSPAARVFERLRRAPELVAERRQLDRWLTAPPVLARDGVAEPNLVWKDTVLVRTGQTVDILFDVSNPGLWMAHCHIAEHMQSGMMFSFNVAREREAAR